jgi:hypothetical protein
MNEDLKEIRSDIREMKDVLIRNTVSLEAHIRRTDLAEDRIEKLEKYHLGFLVSAIALLAGILGRLLVK